MILTLELVDFPRFEYEHEVADEADCLRILQQYEGFVVWYDLTDADGNVIMSSN